MNNETIEVIKGMVADGAISQESAEKYCHQLMRREDERMKKAAIEFVKQNNSFNCLLGISRGEIITWLEKQGEENPNANEWSEEDERLFQIIIDILDRENHLGNISHTDLIACVRKLKSLRPKNHWKPTKKQLKALSDFIQYNVVTTPSWKTLNSLLKDLSDL